jgi:hypothetical protein
LRGFCVALAEPIDTSGAIDELLFASVEWMAIIADFDMSAFHGRAYFDNIAAGTRKFSRFVFWMCLFLHKNPPKTE